MTNLNNQVYLCKEIFDENSEPTDLEIKEHAYRLGIDPVNELHLLCIAKQCLLEPLPPNWFPCFIEKENKYFYYNHQSKQSQWEHPLDEYYRRIVEKKRCAENSSTSQDVSLNIISDEDNLLQDVMYHTKNKNYEKKALIEKRTVRFKTPIEESLDIVDIDNSDDNMKFLGPIKLNTPYTNSSTLLNLPQFSTNNTFDTKSTGSRSGFSKYNILPSKDELIKKFDYGENSNKLNEDESSINIDYKIGKETLRKIDITLTESSDRSESTSSEIHTENLNNEYEINDIKQKDVITTIGINKHYERNNIINNDNIMKSTNNNFNEFQSIDTTQFYQIKKDDLVSDSGNSTAKDSKIIQSPIITNSVSATKSKMAEITQSFPLNQSTSETKILNITKKENDECLFDNSSNSIKSKYMNNGKQMLLDDAHIKLVIENYCDIIKNQLEDTIKTKENIFREEIIKTINGIIRKENDNLEKNIEARHNEHFIKNELELKNTLKNIHGETEKSLIEQCDKKYIPIANEKMCTENFIKFQKDLENYAETFKNKTQTELDIISNELKQTFSKNSEIVTDTWNQTLESYKNIELNKLEKHFEHTTENIKHEIDVEINNFKLEFKEKLKGISNDKLNNATDELDMALREEINLVKKRITENHQHNVNINRSIYKPQSKLSIDCINQEFNSGFQTTDVHKINYCDIRKKIQHCSNELNDALKLVNEISINEYPTVSSVSCQTENIITPHLKPSIKEYNLYPETLNTSSILNNPYDINTKYANYWNQAKMSQDLCSNYMATYSQIINPLDVLGQEELKVNAVEQNICRLIDTFNNPRYTSVYHTPNKFNIFQNKFTNIFQALTPKQIAFNRTKQLREWLYKTDLKNE